MPGTGPIRGNPSLVVSSVPAQRNSISRFAAGHSAPRRRRIQTPSSEESCFAVIPVDFGSRRRLSRAAVGSIVHTGTVFRLTGLLHEVPGLLETCRVAAARLLFRRGVRFGVDRVDVSLSQLLEESVEIAWVYLQQTGELENDAARYLSDVIEVMIRRGQRNRMFLANMAIIKYRASKDRGNVVPIREDVGTVLGSPN
jgi:hypothetical protein